MFSGDTVVAGSSETLTLITIDTGVVEIALSTTPALPEVGTPLTIRAALRSRGTPIPGLHGNMNWTIDGGSAGRTPCRPWNDMPSRRMRSMTQLWADGARRFARGNKLGS